MEDLVGKWELESRDSNMYEFLTCRKVSWFMKNLVMNLPSYPEFTLSEDKSVLTKITHSSLKTTVYPMTIDEEFVPGRTLSGEEEIGRLFETSGRRVIQEMRYAKTDEVAALIERKVIDNKLFVSLKCKDIEYKEVYKRHAEK